MIGTGKPLQLMLASNGSVTLNDETVKCGRKHVIVGPGSSPYRDSDICTRPLHFL